MTGEPPRQHAHFILIALILVPTAVGVLTGTATREPTDDFYGVSAQVIATLFLAITVDFFARQAAGRGFQDAVIALVLAGQSWLGFFACVRALTGGASDWTQGLTAMGITAASVLLAVGLYDTMMTRKDVTHREQSLAALVILIVLFAAIALLLF